MAPRRKKKGYTAQHRCRLKKARLREFYAQLKNQETPNNSSTKNNPCALKLDENPTQNEVSVTQSAHSNHLDINSELDILNFQNNSVIDVSNEVKSQKTNMSMFDDDCMSSDDEEENADNLICNSKKYYKESDSDGAYYSDTDEEDESYERPTSNPNNTSDNESTRMAEFVEEFITWTLTSKLSRENLKALMSMLRKYFNANLPKDPRTLLKTPKDTKVFEMSNGVYWHYGLKKILNKIIAKYEACNIDVDTIKLSLSVDGAPLGNSSKKGLWIISISDEIFKDVYVVGAHHGAKKPDDANELLTMLVDELIETINDGYSSNAYKKKYNIRLIALICDVPAKSYVLKVKGHTGYDSCTKCVIKGKSIGPQVYFHIKTSRLPELRTDEKVKNMEYKKYQQGESILFKIPHFGAVSNVYIDIMHQMYLGNTRKLVMLWMHSPTNTRLKPEQIKQLSARLEVIRQCTPIEFNRTVTSLDLTKRAWKATVYRQFLHYSGPASLKGILKPDLYANFITLHIAMAILVTEEYCTPDLIDFADKLLQIYVKSFAKIYGKKFVSHNVHNCLHLADEARTDGPLEQRSAFRFENAIREVKLTITRPERALQQLDRRTAEKEYFANSSSNPKAEKSQFQMLHRNGPVVPHEILPSQQWKRMSINSFTICSDRRNDQFALIRDVENLKVVQCLNFVKIKSDFYVVGKEMKVTGNVYDEPYPSCDWNMVKIENPADNHSDLKLWLCSNLKSKIFKMIVDDDHIVVPLRHTQ